MAGVAVAGGAFLMPRIQPLMASPDRPVILNARPGKARLLDDQPDETAIWGYSAQVPGPLLRVRRGQDVWFQLLNNLPQPTTIHWHGIRIDNAMDGVAHLTQHAVEPGQTFDYRFRVPDAGTYWYHPHHLSWEQVARGLYGVLIVEEDEPPQLDQDLFVVADDWRLREDGQIDTGSFGNMHDIAHAGRLGNVLTLNGKPTLDIAVTSGERIRLRLLNSCNARILSLRFEDVDAELLALDGQPVPPVPLADGAIELAPAQRADLLLTMTGEPGSKAAITETSNDRLVAGQFVYHPSERKEPPAASVKLAENAIPTPSPADQLSVDLVMSGGAMGRLQEAAYKGEVLPLRELARQHGMAWAFNGVAAMPEKPLFSVPRGRSVSVRMVNESRWPHAMHFHGHHFRETSQAATGKPGPWRDTILIQPDETRTVSFVADNPGKWMIHCHMLEHQAGGMGTWFEVV